LRACAKLIQFDWFVHYSMPTAEDARSIGVLILPRETWGSVFKLR